MSVLERDRSDLTQATVRSVGFSKTCGGDVCDPLQAVLELHETSNPTLHSAEAGYSPPSGYWKIGLLVSDLDRYREKLIAAGMMSSASDSSVTLATCVTSMIRMGLGSSYCNELSRPPR